MKKRLICITLASVMFLCSACGNQNNPSANDVLTEDQEPVKESTEDDGMQETPADNTASDDVSQENQTTGISIEMKTEEDKEQAEDGTVIYISEISYPVVTIEGNEAAAELINADILARVESFKAGTSGEDSTKEMAKEMYDYMLEGEDKGYSFNAAYIEDLGFGITRSDSNVISFLQTYTSYAGGAHGFEAHQGINYSARTGELITISELGEDVDAFYQDTLAYNQKLAETEAYKVRLFTEDSIYNGELEAALYMEGSWYFSMMGLVFFSDPYILGPYAAGMIEFIIPYSDLTEMGLKEEYTYSGKLMTQLISQETYSRDINGDGTEDTFQFYTETKDDGSYETLVHFIINGTDFAQDEDAELQEKFSAYAWSESYLLYDADETDETLEFAFTSYVNENDDYVIYSNIYRYEKDGSLSYLGRIKGSVTDPTVDWVNLEQ